MSKRRGLSSAGYSWNVALIPAKLLILRASNLCKQGVGGSSPPTSTNPFGRNLMEPSSCRDTISLLLSNLPRDYRTLVMNDSSSVKKIKKRDQVGSV